MGGGKSRALCEEAYQAALTYPGISVLIARLEHTAIVGSTRKTMFREVLPLELVKRSRIVKSGGYDFIVFPNGSEIHFVGLNNPQTYHSTEFGMVIVDEAHQVDLDAVQTLNSRLRQKCKDCLDHSLTDCVHMPHQFLCGANPENPGHWLHKAFIRDANETPFGYYKPELRLDPDADPIGDAEFVKALATDNPYLPKAYIERNLGGMETHWRRRYLEGEWLFIDGTCTFSVDALTEYQRRAPAPKYRFSFKTQDAGSKARKIEAETGRIRVYQEPDEDHSYAIGADVATGRGMDYSCAYVVDLTNMALTAEFHGQLDADIFAEQLHFLGKWYGTAVIAVESAGGYGEPVIISLRDGKGGRPPYPNLYRHVLDANIDMDLVQRYGYPMNSKTRPQVIAQLRKAIRERALPYMPNHLIQECSTFCEFEDGNVSPRAQQGCNDDAVMACSIALEMYRRKGYHPDREERLARRRAKREYQPRKVRVPLGSTAY